jgi:hypothetical protein
MRSITLPLPRGMSRKTDTLASEHFPNGTYLRFYSIRYGATRAHAYARGGAEGALGPVVGFGVMAEDAEGILRVEHEHTKRAEVVEEWVALGGERGMVEGA